MKSSLKKWVNRMKRNEFTGTGKVFAFTLRQLLKNRANLISLLISAVVMLVMFPVMSLIGGASGGLDSQTPSGEDVILLLPERIYLTDETDLNVDLSQDAYAGIPVENADFTNETYAESVNTEAGEAWVHLYLAADGYIVDVYASDEVTDPLASHAVDRLDAARLAGMEGLDVLNAPFSMGTYTLEEYENPGDDGMGAYFVQLIYSVVVMLVSMFAAAYIVQSVVEEKTSRLVETLMISVRPLALILGKILAVMVYVFGMMSVYAVCGVLSNLINRKFLGGGSPADVLGSMGVPLAELSINPGTVAAAIFSLLLGYMTYALLSGMSGAGCSEPEDIQSANSTSIMIVMGCYMIALITSMMESQAVAVVTSLIPMVSVFCAPVQFMMGNIGVGVLAAAWILQIGVIALLVAMCAKIYEELIIYRGKRLTFTQIVKIALRKEA